MKLAWLIQDTQGDPTMRVVFTEPDARHTYFKVVAVAYIEIIAP